MPDTSKIVIEDTSRITLIAFDNAALIRMINNEFGTSFAEDVEFTHMSGSVNENSPEALEPDNLKTGHSARGIRVVESVSSQTPPPDPV